MDLVKLFAKEEQIAGLAVSESNLHLVLLEKNKKSGNVTVKATAYEPLPVGVVENGRLKDKVSFAVAIGNLEKKIPYKITCAILALPHHLAYSKIFRFPGAVIGEKLNETMKAMMIGFSLPNKIEDIYLDWERLNSEINEVFLQTIPKETVNEYVGIFQQAGIKVAALESDAVSLARAINIRTQAPILLISREAKRTSFMILKNRDVRFTRTIPKKLEEKELQMEIKRLSDFYEAEDAPIAEIIDQDRAEMAPKFNQHPDMAQKSHEWLSAVGAAMRGLLPRSEDELVSLLPIGTEQAYEFKKNVAFTKFIADLVTALSAFFALGMLGMLILTHFIASGINTQIARLASPPLPQNALAVIAKVEEFNNYVGAINNIDKASPRWSKVIEAIRANTIAGITITDINMPAPAGTITINGVGADRAKINMFKKSIEESGMFTDVKLPITNVDQRADIPFSMTFLIKNPAILYSK